MWTLFIVVDAPRFDKGLRVVERLKLMHVQTCIAPSRIEGFDMPIVGGFARSREIQLHAMVERPRFERLRHELRAVIDGD